MATRRTHIIILMVFLIFFIIVIELGFSYIPFALAEDIPIFKDGSIMWKSPVGTLSLILGDPGTGGWFSFPYLYTCSQDYVLVWNFLEGYPKLVYRYHEPGAKDIVGYKNFLLVQVKDGINIYQMDTATSFITYGGIYLPCDNGHLLWGTSAISPTLPTVHVECPDGKVYGLYKWDFHITHHFKSSDHTIPIPPMVWKNVQKVYRNRILVSNSLPLFVEISNGVCETKNYFVTRNHSYTFIHTKEPPYTAIYQSTGTPICGNEDTIVIYKHQKNSSLLNIWSKGITSSISLPEKPLSIMGSYDHFIVTTQNKAYLLSTVPQYIVKTASLPQPLYVKQCDNVICLIGSEKSKKILWFGFYRNRYFPSIPWVAEKNYRDRFLITKDFKITPTTSQVIVAIQAKNGTYLINKRGKSFLPGMLIHPPNVSLDYKTTTLWWVKDKKLYHCLASPAAIHLAQSLDNNSLIYTDIWCLEKTTSQPIYEGISIYTVIIILILVILMARVFFRKLRKKKRYLSKNYRVKTNKTNRHKIGKRQTKKRKIWRYSS